jgi:hypothetical protein
MQTANTDAEALAAAARRVLGARDEADGASS